MRSLFVFLFFLLCCITAIAQSDFEKLKEVVEDNTKQIKTVSIKLDTLNSQVDRMHKPCAECLHELNWLWVYVLLPIVLFVVFSLYFLKWLKKDGFKLSDALSGDLTSEQINTLQTQQISANTTLPIILNRSSSRLIAFLSSLTAVILAICLFSYYMYFSIKGLTPPNFENLWTILAAIGIGVVPYASKVISQGNN